MINSRYDVPSLLFTETWSSAAATICDPSGRLSRR
jgi:hypothetical protein